MNTGRISVRVATLGDFKAIKNYDEFLGDRRLDLQRRELLVADFGEAAASGFLKFTSSAFLNRPLIEIVCVSPEVRRNGIASALILTACNMLAGSQVYLTSEESNDAMCRLLLKLGWDRVGHIDGFNFSGERELIFRWGDWIF